MNDSEHAFRAFKRAYQSRESDFYRAFYAQKKFNVFDEFPRTHEDWASIPMLTKEDIVDAPFWERVFIPIEDVLSIRTSSGTTGKGLGLIPRERFSAHRRKHVRKNFCFLYLNGAVYMKSHHQGITIVAGDPSDLPASARMLAVFQADTIEGTPSLIASFVPYLAPVYDMRLITNIELDGELMSPAQLSFFRKHFPNASIGNTFAMSEAAGVIGHSCEWMDEHMPNCIHVLHDMYAFEIIDPETGTNIADPYGEGEVVLTTLWESAAFPLIRFRTGDRARRLSSVCPMHPDTPIYQLGGRLTRDRLMIPGGMIFESELARTIAPYRDAIGEDYVLHIFDHETDSSLTIRAELHVSSPNGMLSVDELAAHVQQTLRIGPGRIYADGVTRGLYQPLICVLLRPETGKNHAGEHMIRH